MNEDLTKEELLLKLASVEEAYEKIKQRARKFIQENQEIRLYHSCKSNAKKKGVAFSISVEDIIIPEVCPIMGIKLTNTSNKGRVKTNASIDRIDPTKGYVKGNIQVISDLANRMKQNATSEELINFAKGILKIYAGIDVDKIITQSE